MPSSTPTRYAVLCPVHGRVYLTKEEYDAAMFDCDRVWQCPALDTEALGVCGRRADFDDDNYEEIK